MPSRRIDRGGSVIVLRSERAFGRSQVFRFRGIVCLHGISEPDVQEVGNVRNEVLVVWTVSPCVHSKSADAQQWHPVSNASGGHWFELSAPCPLSAPEPSPPTCSRPLALGQ